jgi:uncharacterized protein YwgA
MNINYSKEVLLNIINKKKGVGKTALMKIVFMLQQIKKLELGYHFQIYTYGPYTAEVSDDIDELVQNGYVDSRMHQFIDYVGYELTISKKASDLVGALSENDGICIDDVLAYVKGKAAKVLELHSTIVFLNEIYKKNNLPSEKDEVIANVKDIKPHFSVNKITAAYDELVDKKYIA